MLTNDKFYNFVISFIIGNKVLLLHLLGTLLVINCLVA